MTKTIGEKPQPDATPTERGWEIPLKGSNADDAMEVIVAIRQLATKIDASFPPDPLIVDFDEDLWVQNRELPASFGPIQLEDGNKVIELVIDADDHQVNDFYNWQGKEYFLVAPSDGVESPSEVSFKLYIDPDWANVDGELLPSLWLTVYRPDTTRSFPVIGPYFVDGEFQQWFSNVGYTPAATTLIPDFGTWVEIKVKVDINTYVVEVDGVVVAQNLAHPNLPVGTKIESLILYGYNGNNDYTALFDEIAFGPTE